MTLTYFQKVVYIVKLTKHIRNMMNSNLELCRVIRAEKFVGQAHKIQVKNVQIPAVTRRCHKDLLHV